MSGTETSTGGGDSLSPAEQAYFSSGGEDATAVLAEYGGGSETAAPVDVKAPAAPAPGAADDDDDDAGMIVGADGKPRDPASGKFVPHEALHKERSRRKAVEAESLTMKEKLARADERLSLLTEIMNTGGAAPAAPGAKAAAPDAAADPFAEADIDPEEDVFAALKQAQRRNAALIKRMQDGDTQAAAQKELTTVKTTYQEDAKAFLQKTPDFKEAYPYLINSLHRELELMGVSDKAQRDAAIAQQESELVKRALKEKMSPAELIYSIATTRGFKAGAPGAAPTPTPAPGASAADKLANVQRAQDAVVSLGKAGGSSGEVLTMAALADMPEAEFQRAVSRLSKSQQRQLMGG